MTVINKVVLPYAGYAGVYPYAAAPVIAYAPLGMYISTTCLVLILYTLNWMTHCFPESGLVYPVAEAYVHDPAGDISDDSYPEAEAYVHDPTGDA